MTGRYFLTSGFSAGADAHKIPTVPSIWLQTKESYSSPVGLSADVKFSEGKAKRNEGKRKERKNTAS
jgi:hypothetical protein